MSMTKLVFKTKAEAVKFLQEQDYLYEHSSGFSHIGACHLAHGEYSVPDFKPCRYKDGWSIKKVHYFYAETFNIPKDGRCGMLDDSLVLESVIW